jgi:hypothetical protein
LLGILLAKIGSRWLKDVEKLADDSRNTLKVGGARGTFETHRHFIDRNGCLESWRVNQSLVGGKDEIDLFLSQQTEISFDVSRVECQILVHSKLRGVNKDANRDTIILAPGAPNQGKVTFVQVTHGWYQAPSQARL